MCVHVRLVHSQNSTWDRKWVRQSKRSLFELWQAAVFCVPPPRQPVLWPCTLAISRLGTGRIAKGRGFRWRVFGGVATPFPGPRATREEETQLRAGTEPEQPPSGSEAPSTPALAKISGAPPAGLSELSSAPAPGFLPGPGRPRRLRGRGSQGGAASASARGGPGDDTSA